ncbi:MAG: hypothetical protein LAT55_02680 [Opitutales bacterium]|nr:hypothetical protein [Opitutales bacterium]
MSDDPHQHLYTSPLPSAKILDSSQEHITLTPDTPGKIPGNSQYALVATFAPRNQERCLNIVWPPNREEALAGFDYPHNHNFAKALPEVLFLRKRGQGWTRISPCDTHSDGVTITLPSHAEPVEFSVGLPYFQSDFERLQKALENGPWEKTIIGNSRRGRPIPAYFRPATKPTQTKGAFALMGYAHYSEWAGLQMLDGLLQTNWKDLPAAEDFAWAIIPALNIDALYGGWREDPMYTREDPSLPGGGNLNRAWNPPCRPETEAAAIFLRKIHNHTPLLHVLDIHMGWSRMDHSGGGLTVFQDGEIPRLLAEKEKAFTDQYLREVPIEHFPWKHSRLEGMNAAAWAVREFGIIGQTLEISRFRAFDKNKNPLPVSEDYYRNLGPQNARTLINFYKSP